MSHYAREEDIASLRLEGFAAADVYGEDHPWGLLLRDRRDNRVVGVELWGASRQLPRELLHELPAAAGEELLIERQRP